MQALDGRMSTGAKHFLSHVYLKQPAGMLLGMAYTETTAARKGEMT